MKIENGILISVGPEDIINGECVVDDGVTEISWYAFFRRTNLKGVSFPNSLKEIGAGAFDGCVNLENVSFPDGLKK